MSGQLSFSVALLNALGDGVVLSSINGRTETRTYAKIVRSGAGMQALSPEEEHAVRTARLGQGLPAAERAGPRGDGPDPPVDARGLARLTRRAPRPAGWHHVGYALCLPGARGDVFRGGAARRRPRRRAAVLPHHPGRSRRGARRHGGTGRGPDRELGRGRGHRDPRRPGHRERPGHPGGTADPHRVRAAGQARDRARRHQAGRRPPAVHAAVPRLARRQPAGQRVGAAGVQRRGGPPGRGRAGGRRAGRRLRRRTGTAWRSSPPTCTTGPAPSPGSSWCHRPGRCPRAPARTAPRWPRSWPRTTRARCSRSSPSSRCAAST